MTEQHSIHPYYIAKAEAALKAAQAPSGFDPMPLARWASEEHPDDVALITADGQIVGHARYSRGGDVQAYYIVDCEQQDKIGYELGFAGRVNGERVVHIKWYDVAQGADPRG
jgi:hypothetical protein